MSLAKLQAGDVVIINNAPRSSEVAKKHDKKKPVPELQQSQPPYTCLV